MVMVSSSCIDVAVLQLQRSSSGEKLPVARCSFAPLTGGQPILALGHAVWGSLHRKPFHSRAKIDSGTHLLLEMAPSATAGVVSRVVEIEGKTAMILTDVAIHKGNSGGMLLSADGCVVGLAAFNARMERPNSATKSTVTIPRTNFSLPLSFLQPLLEHPASLQGMISLYLTGALKTR